MRITIEIDERTLESVRKCTGIDKMSPAVVHALEEFLKQQERDAFLRKVLDGKTDYVMTNEELESLAEYDQVSS